MRVKLKTMLSGPDGNHHPGDEIDVSDTHGRDLVNGGFASELQERRPEFAVLEVPAETAALKRRRK